MDKIGIVALWLYGIASQIFTLYFLYLWSNTHGFLNTVTIGVLVAEFKGLLFPFFL
jgi:hypothetical protein